MSWTNISEGMEEAHTNSTRVLKPPGGGTSQLFSNAPEDKPNTIVPQSSKGASTHCSATNLNGVEALNGKNGNEITTGNETSSLPGEEKKGSDLDLLSTQSSVLSAEIRHLSAQEDKRHHASLMARNCVTGEGCQTTDHYVIRVHRQRDGNPVTGEGYDTSETQPSGPARTRIPPGGYSSGLW